MLLVMVDVDKALLLEIILKFASTNFQSEMIILLVNKMTRWKHGVESMGLPHLIPALRWGSRMRSNDTVCGSL